MSHFEPFFLPRLPWLDNKLHCVSMSLLPGYAGRRALADDSGKQSCPPVTPNGLEGIRVTVAK